MSDYQPVRLAFIGAGIFVHDSYLPALASLGDTYEVVAVGSRTRASAEQLAAKLPGAVDSYNNETLDDMLARDDIEVVSIVTPITVLPDLIERALKAGKHIISEKPITPDVITGQQLLALYREHPDQHWMVAENWRYEPAFIEAAAALRAGKIGRPLLAHWTMHTRLDINNKYYHTEWRRSGDFPGGFILDGGVHHIAAMRMVLGDNVVSVAAHMAQMRDDLPPVDTLSTSLKFAQGTIGTYTVTYAAGVPWQEDFLHIIGDRGTLRVLPHRLEISMDGNAPIQQTHDRQGVADELAAFAAALREGKPHRNTPEEALQDVAVIEAMLYAAESGERVSPAQVI